MSAFIWTFAICAVLFLSLMSLGNRFTYLRRSYFQGISVWSSWLPLFAAVTIFVILGLNAVSHPAVLRHDLGLSFLSRIELVFVLAVVPLLITGAANYVAIGLTLYLVERLLIGSPGISISLGAILFLASTTVIAILGDYLPWARPKLGLATIKLREFLVVALSVGSLALVVVSLLRVGLFSQWMATQLALDISPSASFIGLMFILCGWISVAIGMTRHFMLPALCLPSIIILAFVSQWPPYLLVVPFAAGLALSLAIADRRRVRRNA